ncbi:MAG TPA: metalloregulator ArsR/SmtB family transcription factor [Nocardioidaceae bacterium]|nr:metalloregulator ArsR/SmtB family transcription factor [Nocardioidaceae bacterium]
MDVFEALADPVRRDILRRLSRGPARVNDLAAEHPVSRPAISRHLRVLREAGLVEADHAGRERPHRLVTGGLTPLRELLTELAPTTPPFADSALDGLELEVRRTTRERRTAPDTRNEETA